MKVKIWTSLNNWRHFLCRILLFEIENIILSYQLFQVFIILAIFSAISTAHHTPQHRTIDTDTSTNTDTTDTDTTILDDREEEQDTDQGETETPKNVESRHHNPQVASTSQGVPVLIPYPVLRSTPTYYHQPIQYVPILHEYPTARQGVGGGASAHLGPIRQVIIIFFILWKSNRYKSTSFYVRYPGCIYWFIYNPAEEV